MSKIIFITSLTLWSMGRGHGGPAFTQTVQKYIREGWEVYLVSDEPSNAGYPELDRAHNIVLKKSPFYQFSRKRKIGFFFRLLDQWYTGYRFRSVVSELVKGSPNDTVLYAYEIYGVPACKKLSSTYHLPLVTRFQGTVLSGVKKFNAHARLYYYSHLRALSTPADLVIMTDDGTLGDQVLNFLHNSSPIAFWKNGLELLSLNYTVEQIETMGRQRRAALGLDEDDFMLLTVSRLVGWKRVERSIHGLQECAARIPNAKLVVVGDGEARASLEALTRSLGVEGRVIFTGSVPHSEVYSYMAAADVFLSLYDLSNVGNPLLEAMTLGKCIITLDVGNTAHEITDRKTGILLTYETLDSLGERLVELYEDPALRRKLGEDAAAYAREHYWTWESRMDAEIQRVQALFLQEHRM